MDILSQLIDEFNEEYNTTKKFFKAFPEGKNDYAPHQKSMKIKDLSNHIADIFEWPSLILSTSNLDFAEGYNPEQAESQDALESKLEKGYNASISALKQASTTDLEPKWSIGMNGEKIMEWTKYGAIRHGLNQITHHRAQLGVYYRLLEISVPASYGPSADEQSF